MPDLAGPVDALHPDVLAALQASGAPDRVVVHRHADLPQPIDSAAAFARAVGCAPGQVAKTLLLARAGAGPDEAGGLALACLGSPERLSFAAAAAALGWGRCSMAPRGTPERRLGQPPGSVSPLAPGGLPVLVDRGLAGYDRVMVGAGRLGLDIELPLALLLTLSRGTWHAIAEPPKEG